MAIARRPRTRAYGLQLLERRCRHEFPVASLVPRTADIGFAAVADARGIVEILIDKSRRRRNPANRERRLAQALQSRGERLHVRDLARHQELQSVDRARIVGEIDQPFVDDLRARFRRDIAPQIDVEFARDLQVIRGPRSRP